ncbi:hypothetical protein VR7878_01874 [Vibrio ruber DSM 16370]|uniref:Uncharacterized protein n=1 Tax=Vibrio ruber (strain DSM 16370 / JCM 11486 / BCRC 17186 / CECT 7878 / LMG 23124 / VR1) TaxID=1123498 RepID=A0A1R4LJ65_VIBR1|nr:hypothetical protein VR7878_01874 [Vibrio ruber DSM 16370]
MTQFFIRGITINHRVHVTGSNAKKQVGLPQRHEVFFVMPCRLSNNPDPESLSFEQTADNRHAKARVINIGITGHDDDITAIPAQLIHFFSTGRQKWCVTEAFGPVGFIVMNWRGDTVHILTS